MGAFEIKYNNLLIFSKIMHGIFANTNDIANIIYCICQKRIEDINKIRYKLQKSDLYGYLKINNKNIRFSLKFCMN